MYFKYPCKRVFAFKFKDSAAVIRQMLHPGWKGGHPYTYWMEVRTPAGENWIDFDRRMWPGQINVGDLTLQGAAEILSKFTLQEFLDARQKYFNESARPVNTDPLPGINTDELPF